MNCEKKNSGINSLGNSESNIKRYSSTSELVSEVVQSPKDKPTHLQVCVYKLLLTIGEVQVSYGLVVA